MGGRVGGRKKAQSLKSRLSQDFDNLLYGDPKQEPVRKRISFIITIHTEMLIFFVNVSFKYITAARLT